MAQEISKQAYQSNVADSSAASRMSAKGRRQQLIETAIRLFSQKGFRGTTTKEIAQAAGVTEAMIFRHFKSKDDLYAAILDYKACEVKLNEKLEELRAHAERGDDEKLFRTLAAKILAHHRRDRDFMRLMLYSALEKHELARNFRKKQMRPLHDFLRDYIVRRQGEGAFRDCDATAAVQSFLGAVLHQSMMTGLFNADFLKLTDKDAIENFTRLFLNGLRQSPARRRAKKYKTE
ncbi:MAG TPA: TetR/AcrR family transcriptional regulator [Blastocatellia bacterium]|nr:TetR/AcrR family transcriptional regulator [Blastocatellia bacterium]